MLLDYHREWIVDTNFIALTNPPTDYIYHDNNNQQESGIKEAFPANLEETAEVPQEINSQE